MSPYVTTGTEQLGTRRHYVFNYSGFNPSSLLYDNAHVIDTGSSAHDGTQHVLSSGQLGISYLDTTMTARYAHGMLSEASLGIRVPTPPTGQMRGEWGVNDEFNGWGFGIDATGLYTFFIVAETQTVIRRADWNGDKLDGSGSSGLTLNTAHMNEYVIRMDSYGYAEFLVSVPNAAGAQTVVVHRLAPANYPLMSNPCLPVRAMCSNDATDGTNFNLVVGGRAFSILGEYTPVRRRSSHGIINQSVNSAGYVPLATVRRAALSPKNTTVFITGYEYLCPNDGILTLALDSALTSPTWGVPSGLTSGESVCEADAVATATVGGVVLHKSMIKSGSPCAVEFQSPIPLPRGHTITLSVKAIGVQTVILASAQLIWVEER